MSQAIISRMNVANPRPSRRPCRTSTPFWWFIRAEQVGERFDATAAECGHHREEQTMQRDRVQAWGLTGVAPELIDRLDAERLRTVWFGKPRGRQGW